MAYPNVAAPQDGILPEDGRKRDMVCLDISGGSIYISDSGYRIGDDAEKSVQGFYKITGNSQEDYGIKILGGEHTI